MVALLVCACGIVRAQAVTIEFVADREEADDGEAVNWTVFVTLPPGATEGAWVDKIAGDMLPSDMSGAEIDRADSLLLKEIASPVRYGAALFDATLRMDRGNGVFAASKVPVLTFRTVMQGDNRPLWYTFYGSIDVTDPLQGHNRYTRRENGRSDDSLPIRVITDRVNVPSCGEADLASPWGSLTPTDITSYMTHFITGGPLADLAAPWGVNDYADIHAFFTAYASGCW